MERREREGREKRENTRHRLGGHSHKTKCVQTNELTHPTKEGNNMREQVWNISAGRKVLHARLGAEDLARTDAKEHRNRYVNNYRGKFIRSIIANMPTFIALMMYF